jgi:carboxymethylenebutenolidase
MDPATNDVNSTAVGFMPNESYRLRSSFARMNAGDVTLTTSDGPMRTFEAIPDGTSKGAIVVVQEAFGVNPHIEDVTRRCAAAGYHAVAPDLFHRSGSGCVVEYGNFEKVLEYFGDVSGDAAVLADIEAALDHLRGSGFADAQIGIVGFCFGGRVTFLTALRHALGAAVGFYGGGIVTGRFPQFPALIDGADQLQTPWLGLFGDQDGSIPVDDVETLRATLAKLPIDTEIVRYAEAGHGFHCDARPDYRADDAADAWNRALDWFAAHLSHKE